MLTIFVKSTNFDPWDDPPSTEIIGAILFSNGDVLIYVYIYIYMYIYIYTYIVIFNNPVQQSQGSVVMSHTCLTCGSIRTTTTSACQLADV